MRHRLTSGQLASLERAADRTRAARVAPNTAASHAARVEEFYDHCEDELGTEPHFSYDNLSKYFYDYVTAGTGTKQRAHPALLSFLSAFSDFATDTEIDDFQYTYPGTRARARIERYIQGIENEFPHVVQRDVPITYGILEKIAPMFGIDSPASLWIVGQRCPERLLAWGRLITAHDA